MWRYEAWKLNDKNNDYLNGWKYFNTSLTKHYLIFTVNSQFSNHRQDDQGWGRIPTVNLLSFYLNLFAIYIAEWQQVPSRQNLRLTASKFIAALNCFLDVVSITQTTKKTILGNMYFEQLLFGSFWHDTKSVGTVSPSIETWSEEQVCRSKSSSAPYLQKI